MNCPKSYGQSKKTMMIFCHPFLNLAFSALRLVFVDFGQVKSVERVKMKEKHRVARHRLTVVVVVRLESLDALLEHDVFRQGLDSIRRCSSIPAAG